jgi:glycolate oxidase
MFDKEVSVQAKKVDDLVRELFRKVVEMRGTISGEHGIGITKAPYLDMELAGPVIQLMARIKKAFDPKGILNPGKIFPYKT